MIEERVRTQEEQDFYDEYGCWPITDADLPESAKIILTDEQIAGAERAVLIKNAKTYLKETDWYVTRYAETGTEIPAEVLTKRAQARLDASDS